MPRSQKLRTQQTPEELSRSGKVLALPALRLIRQAVAAMREAAIAAVTTESAIVYEPGRASAARTLKANLPGQTCLSPAEQHLLGDWLDRLSG